MMTTVDSHDCSIHYKWQVLFNTVLEGSYNESVLRKHLDELRPQSGYVLCPGLKEYPEEIRFKTKNLRQWGLPFNRIDSKDCHLWHIPHNIHHPTGDELRDTCKSCRLLYHDIKQLMKLKDGVSAEKKSTRLSIHSNYPLKYLSPQSTTERVLKMSKDRKNLTSRLSHIKAELEYDVSDKQHAELLEIVESIDTNGKKVVDELCDKFDGLPGFSGDSNPLREVWQQDVIERLQYKRDQTKNCKSQSYADKQCLSHIFSRATATSNRGIKWSAITIRMG